MQYLMLIYHPEASWDKLTEAELGSIYQEYAQNVQSLTKAGKYLGGNQLKPVGTATTVRVRDSTRMWRLQWPNRRAVRFPRWDECQLRWCARRNSA